MIIEIPLSDPSMAMIFDVTNGGPAVIESQWDFTIVCVSRTVPRVVVIKTKWKFPKLAVSFGGKYIRKT